MQTTWNQGRAGRRATSGSGRLSSLASISPTALIGPPPSLHLPPRFRAKGTHAEPLGEDLDVQVCFEVIEDVGLDLPDSPCVGDLVIA